MMLGIVSANGVIYYTSDDINACRRFLRSRGLECSRDGWKGRDGATGAIYFDGHPGAKWWAAVWPPSN